MASSPVEHRKSDTFHSDKGDTWHQVPANPNDYYNVPNYTKIKELLGKVNSEDFDGDPPGTVLFTSVEPKFVKPQLNLGIPTWDISMSFIVKNNGAGLGGANPEDATAGHNYLLNTYLPIAQWDLVTSGANVGTVNGDRIYEAGDLNELFEIG